jgi:outer membrane receptor protein involved in Fe transport
MKTIISFTFLLFLGFNLFAQSGGRITGSVADSVTHQALEYATLTVADKQSKQIINGAATDAGGKFEVTGLPVGQYLITIDFIGYNKKTIDSVSITNARQSVSLNSIFLSSPGHTLKAVVIKGSAPIVENKIDKIVYNAANDITAQGGLALDVLKKVPQVNVDIDGNVELQGNANIRFLINGKPSSVFGNSVIDALAAIPASQIKSIEAITSPGAKYDAQGTGGIINIILKDNKMQGVNGSINLSGGSRLENGSANLNFRRDNVGVNAFFSGNAQLLSRTPNSQSRSSVDANTGATDHLFQDGYSDFQRNGYQTGISMDWSPSKHDNITASATYNHFSNNSESLIRIQQDSTGGASPPMGSIRRSENRSTTNSLDWSVAYRKEFEKEGQELNILYSATFGLPTTGYNQTTGYLNATDPFAGAISNNPGSDRENAISVDYSHPVTKGFMLETGVKTTLQNIVSNSNVSTLQPALDYLPDPGQSYHLKYDMAVYAAYLSTSFSITKMLKLKAGARYEYTSTNIDFPNTAIPAYGTVVPSITLSHDVRQGQFIKLSYSRRIERPDYRDVNPFLNRADPYNLTTGNPLLKPEIGNNIELGYSRSFGKGGNLYVSLNERINTQDHKQVTTFYSQYLYGDSVYTNVSVSDPQNIGTEYNSGINVSGSYTIKDKLSFRSNTSLFHRYIVSGLAGSNGVTGMRFRINLNVSYQLSHSFIAEAFGNYNSPTNTIQGKSPQWITYTIAFRKQFWQGNGSLGLTATNIFNEYTRQVTTISTGSYTSYSVRMLPYRSVGISFTYKFGKLEFRKGKEDDSYMNNAPVMGN